MERADLRGSSSEKLHADAAAEVEHAVFMQSYIPRTLGAVRDVDADVAKVMKGDTSGLYYAALTGMDAIGLSAAAAHAESASAKAAAAAEASAAAEPGPLAADSATLSTAVPRGPSPPVTLGSLDQCVVTGDLGDSDRNGGRITAEAHVEPPGVALGAADAEESSSGSEDSDSDEDDEDMVGTGAGCAEDGAGGAFTKRLASKDERRAHKAAVKEEKRERRKVSWGVLARALLSLIVTRAPRYVADQDAEERKAAKDQGRSAQVEGSHYITELNCDLSRERGASDILTVPPTVSSSLWNDER